MTLNWQIFGVPVRVHWTFLLMSAFLAQSRDALQLLVWCSVVFVSVLLHEFGHALSARAFGCDVAIELHSMGGTTSHTGVELTPLQRMWVSFAGPLMGFVLGTLLLLIKHRFAEGTLGASVVRDLYWVNIGWGVFNLLPVLPLDGGNVMASFLKWVTRGGGQKTARVVSIVVAGLLLLGAISIKWIWVGVLAALFIFQNVQGLRAEAAAQENGPAIELLRGAIADLEAGRADACIAKLHDMSIGSPELRAEGLRVLAHAYAASARWDELVALVRGEAREALTVQDLETIEGRATAAQAHDIAGVLATVRREREKPSGTFRA